MRATQEFRYEKLTWPEINDAIETQHVDLAKVALPVMEFGDDRQADLDVACSHGEVVINLPSGSQHAVVAGKRTSATFHGLAAAVIGFPLLWEATIRFEILPPWASAAATALTTSLGAPTLPAASTGATA